MAIKNNYPTIRPTLDLNFAGSKVVDPRVTFSRPSTATYYDGKTVAKAEENLLAYSQTFSGAWGRSQAGSTLPVVSDNFAVAPDGTTTAAKIDFGDVSLAGNHSEIRKSFAASAAPYTRSIYFKAASESDIGKTIYFYFSDPVVGLVAVTLTADWKRVSATSTLTAGTRAFGFGSIGANFGGAAQTGFSALVWGAQLEQRDQATAYTPTTDQPITRYQPVLMTAPANTPRIDHDPITGECKGLLIEESRTNLLTYSSDFSSSWTTRGAGISSNQAVSPVGTLSAAKAIPGGNDQQIVMIPSGSYGAGIYTLSVFAKAGQYRYVGLALYDNVTYFAGAMFDLQTGTFITSAVASGGSYSIFAVGNGWFRISITGTASAGLNRNYSGIRLGSNSVPTGINETFSGDGYSGIYIWGAQLEAGAFPTSYIKTEASQVTRAADNAVMTGANFSSWYRQDEFTLTADVAPIGGTTSFAVSINNGFDQRALALQYCGGNGTIRKQSETFVNPTSYSPLPPRSELPRGSRTKTAASFKVGGYANNSFDGDIALGAIQIPRLPEHSALRFGNAAIPGTVAWTGHIRRVTGYPVAVSPANLQALTL